MLRNKRKLAAIAIGSALSVSWAACDIHAADPSQPNSMVSITRSIFNKPARQPNVWFKPVGGQKTRDDGEVQRAQAIVTERYQRIRQTQQPSETTVIASVPNTSAVVEVAEPTIKQAVVISVPNSQADAGYINKSYRYDVQVQQVAKEARTASISAPVTVEEHHVPHRAAQLGTPLHGYESLHLAGPSIMQYRYYRPRPRNLLEALKLCFLKVRSRSYPVETVPHDEVYVVEQMAQTKAAPKPARQYAATPKRTAHLPTNDATQAPRQKTMNRSVVSNSPVTVETQATSDVPSIKLFHHDPEKVVTETRTVRETTVAATDPEISTSQKQIEVILPSELTEQPTPQPTMEQEKPSVVQASLLDKQSVASMQKHNKDFMAAIDAITVSYEVSAADTEAAVQMEQATKRQQDKQQAMREAEVLAQRVTSILKDALDNGSQPSKPKGTVVASKPTSPEGPKKARKIPRAVAAKRDRQMEVVSATQPDSSMSQEKAKVDEHVVAAVGDMTMTPTENGEIKDDQVVHASGTQPVDPSKPEAKPEPSAKPESKAEPENAKSEPEVKTEAKAQTATKTNEQTPAEIVPASFEATPSAETTSSQSSEPNAEQPATGTPQSSSGNAADETAERSEKSGDAQTQVIEPARPRKLNTPEIAEPEQTKPEQAPSSEPAKVAVGHGYYSGHPGAFTGVRAGATENFWMKEKPVHIDDPVHRIVCEGVFESTVDSEGLMLTELPKVPLPEMEDAPTTTEPDVVPDTVSDVTEPSASSNLEQALATIDGATKGVATAAKAETPGQTAEQETKTVQTTRYVPLPYLNESEPAATPVPPASHEPAPLEPLASTTGSARATDTPREPAGFPTQPSALATAMTGMPAPFNNAVADECCRILLAGKIEVDREKALATLAAMDSWERHPLSANALIRVALTDYNTQMRRTAVEMLSSMNTVRGSVVETLKLSAKFDADAEIRATAAAAVSQYMQRRGR